MNAAWTLLALATLGEIAAADDDPQPAVESRVMGSSSHRGVAQDYLVLPSGSEITGQMRFVTADAALGTEPLRFTDIGLFDLAGRISLGRGFEIAGGVTLLPKQPSYTDEKPWQHASLAVRKTLKPSVAIALGGQAGHLLSHEGAFTRESLGIEWRAKIHEMVTYELSGGVDAITLSAPNERGGVIGEVGGATSVLFSEPSGHWGGWVGVTYAVPVYDRGEDPTLGMELDAQPRLDFKIGSVLSLDKHWDLFAELAIVDRGDLTAAATRLPILDGGFDQRQIILGATWHVPAPRRAPKDQVLQMSSR